MRFSKADFAVVVSALALSAVSLAFFFADVNASFARDDGDRLGIIVFRKNAASRRGADSLRWEIMKDRAGVFGGDTVRTSGKSEASVLFDDGASLDVLENSMLRLAGKNSGEIELSSGALRVTGGKGASRRVRAGSSIIEVSPESEVSFLADKDTLVVDVSSGTATVKTGNAPAYAITSDEVARVGLKTGTASVAVKDIAPIFPPQGARVVSRDGSGNVTFRARAKAPMLGGLLEISSDVAFSSIRSSIPISSSSILPEGELSVTSSVAEGVWFWRVIAPSGEASPVRRFSLILSSVPSLTWPEDESIIRYRSSLPSVRFSWGGSPEADSYTLELSRSQNGTDGARRIMTAVTSQTVSGLDEGRWYWRVIPEYSRVTVGVKRSSALSSFTILKSDVMDSVGLIAPLEGNLYALKGFESSGLFFSWKPVDGAAGYEMRAYESDSAEAPVARFVSATPWIRLDANSAPFLLAAGTRYWSVVWKDADGSISSESDRRAFTGVDERVAIRPTFPPDGYVVPSSSSESVRFAWKSAVRARTKIILSRDPKFSTNEVERDIDADSAIGISLGAGSWFWKVRMYNVDGASFIETEPRRLKVVDELDAPKLVSPESLPEIVACAGDPVDLSWSPVADAGYYSFALFRAESPGRLVFAQDRVQGTTIRIPAGVLSSGVLSVELRAFSDADEMHMRLFGKTGISGISVRSLDRIELVKPARGASFEALSAMRNGVRLEWRSGSDPDSLSLAVKKDGAAYPIRFSWDGSSSFTLPRLSPGTYTWRLRATCAGVDISPKADGRFIVRAVEPLPPPSIISPENGATLDAVFFSSRKGISFAWSAVPNASSYRFRILSLPSRRVVVSADHLPSPSYRLSDLRCLDRGDFAWEVSAESAQGKSGIAREGRVASARFSVTLPRLTTPTGKGDSEFYAY